MQYCELCETNPSALSAGEPDECLSMRDSKLQRQDITLPNMEKAELLPISPSSHVVVSFIVSAPFKWSNFILLVRQLHRWRSTTLISAIWRRAHRRWKSSIMSKASCRYRNSLESRSVVPHDNACVAPAVSRMSWPMRPRHSFKSSSAVPYSADTRWQRSL